MSADKIVHLRPKISDEQDLDDWKNTAKHMIAQNAELLAKLDDQSGKLDAQSIAIGRLLRSVDILTSEMHDYRTGKKQEAYARLARHDEEGDLLTAKADPALTYPHASTEIGAMLEMAAPRVGRLLGPDGLKWADNSDYQETTRYKPGRMRFWHKDIVPKLKDILLNREPDEFGITKKDVRAIFANYKTQQRQARLPE